MASFLSKLVERAWRNVEEGYYSRWLDLPPPNERPPSMRKAIEEKRGRAVITEIKYSSPSGGLLRAYDNPVKIARAMLEGGAVGVSILTEPSFFNGRVEYVYHVSRELKTPILFKDIIVSKQQVEAALKTGASAVLLIMRIFNAGFCETELESMVKYARGLGLEILLETHGRREFEEALAIGGEVMLGINNRDLDTLTTRLETTIEVLASGRPEECIVVSESGISSPEDIRRLRKAGVDAFLVGSSIMASRDIVGKVRELAEA